MHVVVDGIVYGFQKYGGINTYFNETLPRIAIRHKARVDVLLPVARVGRPPGPPVHNVLRNVVPSRTGISSLVDRFTVPLLERVNSIALQVRLRSKPNSVFHSTYFTWLDTRIPQVACAYDMNHELFPDQYDNPWGHWLRRQYYEYLKRATRIIALSNKTKDDVTRFYGINPDVIDVVHLAVNRDAFWPERGPSQLKLLQAHTDVCLPYILYVGLRHSYKNFSRLLKAFAQSSVRRSAYLVIAGRPWEQGEKETLSELGLESQVRLVVDPSGAMLRRLYSFASAFVYPSYHEGFGIPLLEAMACGTLVLASEIAVFHEVAGNAAVFFDPSNVADISRVLETAFDLSRRQEYVSRGFEHVGKFSWERCADQTHAVYQKAVNAVVP